MNSFWTLMSWVRSSHIPWHSPAVSSAQTCIITHSHLGAEFSLIHLGGPVCLAAVWGLEQRLDWQKTHNNRRKSGLCICVQLKREGRRESWQGWAPSCSYISCASNTLPRKNLLDESFLRSLLVIQPLKANLFLILSVNSAFHSNLPLKVFFFAKWAFHLRQLIQNDTAWNPNRKG